MLPFCGSAIVRLVILVIELVMLSIASLCTIRCKRTRSSSEFHHSK